MVSFSKDFLDYCFALWNLHLWKDSDGEDSEEPVCFRGDPTNPINRPDRYVWKNGDQVHMVCGESVDKQDSCHCFLNMLFKQNFLDLLVALCRSWKISGSKQSWPTERRLSKALGNHSMAHLHSLIQDVISALTDFKLANLQALTTESDF